MPAAAPVSNSVSEAQCVMTRFLKTFLKDKSRRWRKVDPLAPVERAMGSRCLTLPVPLQEYLLLSLTACLTGPPLVGLAAIYGHHPLSTLGGIAFILLLLGLVAICKSCRCRGRATVGLEPPPPAKEVVVPEMPERENEDDDPLTLADTSRAAFTAAPEAPVWNAHPSTLPPLENPPAVGTPKPRSSRRKPTVAGPPSPVPSPEKLPSTTVQPPSPVPSAAKSPSVTIPTQPGVKAQAKAPSEPGPKPQGNNKPRRLPPIEAPKGEAAPKVVGVKASPSAGKEGRGGLKVSHVDNQGRRLSAAAKSPPRSKR
jgi:hypothetical protein